MRTTERDEQVSPEADAWGRVTVGWDGDLIFVTARDGESPAVHTGTIPAIGGTLFVDVTRSGDVPTAWIAEPELAQAWLTVVYGPFVADAVADLAEQDPGESDGTVRHSVSATRGELSGVVGRLGVGHWLHRWWPSGASEVPEIDPRLLELEIGALSWLGEALFVETSSIERLLAPHTDLLAALVEDVRSRAGSQAEQDLGILTTALRAAVDLVDDTVLGYSTAGSLLESIDAENAIVAKALADVDWNAAAASLTDAVISEVIESWRVVAPEPEGEPTVARGGGIGSPGRPLVADASTVDWIQVGPRVVAARDDNVSWAVHVDNEGARLTVWVEGAPNPHGGALPPVLMTRVYLGENPVPRVFALELNRERAVFTGTHGLPDVPDGDIRIDVFEAAHVHRPRLSAEARGAAAAERRGIGELISERHRAGTGDTFLAERAAWDGGRP